MYLQERKIYRCLCKKENNTVDVCKRGNKDVSARKKNKGLCKEGKYG
jgi:hypothetical protein